MSEDYWNGRNGQRFTPGGNYNKYLDGLRDGGHPAPGPDGLGAVGLIVVALVLLVSTSLITVCAALTAVLSTGIMLLIEKPKNGNYRFWKLFGAVFWTSFLFGLLNTGLSLCIIYFAPHLIQEGIQFNGTFWLAVTIELGLFALSAFVLFRRQRRAWGLPFTYKKALAYTGLLILPITLLLLGSAAHFMIEAMDEMARSLVGG